MIISDNFIFVRVPRTASSSLEEALNKYHIAKYDQICKFPKKHKTLIRNHITAPTFKKDNESIWKEKIKFAFVRNPYDRIVSYYSYYHYKYGHYSFEEFVKKFVQEKARLDTRAYWNLQHKWLCDKKGNLIVDYVGKFESLNEDLLTICNKINIDVPKLKHLKNSKRKRAYGEFYNDKTRKIVSEACAKDFELFGYQK